MSSGTPLTMKCPKCRLGQYGHGRPMPGEWPRSTGRVEMARIVKSKHQGHGKGGRGFHGHRGEARCGACGHTWWSTHPSSGRLSSLTCKCELCQPAMSPEERSLAAASSFSPTLIPQAVTGLVLRADRRILAVDNRAHGGVGMPGGKVSRAVDGSIRQAMNRELREETGLVSEEDDLLELHTGLWRFPLRDGGIGPEHEVTLFYVKRVRGIARAVEPGTAPHWLAYDELCARSPFQRAYRDSFGDGVILSNDYAATEMSS